ncbi:MAG: FAD-binding oxidoreductase, partial [Solirubrobacterales bacterium]|nr:FAD-binding oxidoreductase [Solirubrobacterales bacterium]
AHVPASTAHRSNFEGVLLTPGDPGYDSARSLWNGMIDHRPALIARCASVDDVVRAVRTARESDLEIGVRCGGHNIAGLAVPHGGLMIDLTRLDRVSVDPLTRRARVQGGALLGALDRATQSFGLATTAGNVSHTGVGGLTLGGGMGWLARQHGLSCDNVATYTVITAEGEVVRASADEHPDLFWGLRGGGGNFGIVVEFEFRLHPIGTRTLAVDLTFPLARAAAAVRGWRELAAQAPRQATLTAAIAGDTVTLGYVWIGDPAAGRALLPALRSIGAAERELVRELSYLTLQTREDSLEGHAYRRYWKGHYLPELSDGAIEALLDRDPADDSLPGVSLQSYGGAIADVDDDATAFSHRRTRFEYVAAVKWTDPDEDTLRIEAARGAAAKLNRFASGAYVNALSDEGASGVRRAYSEAKRARLTALKDTYDPDNVFHLNHNIVPSRHPESRSG